MAKLYNYIIMMTVLILILKFAGIPVGADSFLNYIGIDVGSSGITTGTFYIFVLGVLIAATVGGIVIGIITRTSPENYIILPIITTSFFFFTIALTSIIDYSLTNFEGWISSIIILIFAPLTIGYIISLIEFFRGTG